MAKKEIPLNEKISVSTEELAILLSCGRDNAVKIGSMAEARCNAGIKNLWNVEKVRQYMNEIATE